MSKSRIKRTKDFETGTVTFTVLETGQTLECSVASLPNDMITKLAVHGLNAKVGDGAASDSVDAIEVMTAIWAQLQEGTWNAKGTGGGGPRVTELAEAYAMAANGTVEQAQAKIADMSDEEKKDLRGHAQVKAAMATIKKAKADAKAKQATKDAKVSEDAPLSLD